MITIDFLPPRFKKVACIDRNDLTGKQARRVLAAINAECARLHLNSPRAIDITAVWHTLVADYTTPFPAWPGTAADDDENGRKWRALNKVYRALLAEDSKLDRLRRYYKQRTYTVKELDDLTPEEWSNIDPLHLGMLDEFERKMYGV